MDVRIKFSADVTITGKNMKEIRSKFEELNLWAKEALDCGAEFSAIELVEDADTYNDLETEYFHAFNK